MVRVGDGYDVKAVSSFGPSAQGGYFSNDGVHTIDVYEDGAAVNE